MRDPKPIMRIGLCGLAFSFFAGLGPARACSCAQPESAAKQLEQADAAFVGHVKSQVTEPSGVTLNRQTRRTTFEVKRPLKGDLGPKFSIDQVMGFTCNAEFQTGKTYVVLLRRVRGELKTDSCMTAIYPRHDYERAAQAQQ